MTTLAPGQDDRGIWCCWARVAFLESAELWLCCNSVGLARMSLGAAFGVVAPLTGR
jgi:hypothetical protein